MQLHVCVNECMCLRLCVCVNPKDLSLKKFESNISDLYSFFDGQKRDVLVERSLKMQPKFLLKMKKKSIVYSLHNKLVRYQLRMYLGCTKFKFYEIVLIIFNDSFTFQFPIVVQRMPYYQCC